MKLKEAIKILTRYGKNYTVRMEPDFDDAVKLGIEALKQVQLARKDFGYIDPSLLLGETIEEERR